MLALLAMMGSAIAALVVGLYLSLAVAEGAGPSIAEDQIE